MSSQTVPDRLQLEHEDAIQQVVFGKSSIDAKLLRWSDWLNPILVKETRQALKSRQFVATFSLTLIAVLVWTVVAIVLMIPGVYYLPGGMTLLTGYFIILLVPVCVVVPMTSFRSMAAELEDGTHDILSLSTLSSRQVVVGKLAVALIQSLVYFSAIIPCIALTYLLRGVGLLSLVFIVLGTVGLSLLFSSISLLFASVARTRDIQVLMTALLFIVIAPATWMWIMATFATIWGEFSVETWDFWIPTLIIMAFGFSYVCLAVLAAAAKIGFATDNHSTRIRWLLLLQHCMYMWVAVGVSAYSSTDDGGVWMAMLSVAGIHWVIAGTLILGERPYISPRARRTFPKSTIGRLFRTWLNPGAGPGYIFVVTTFGSSVVLLVLFQLIDWNLNFGNDDDAITYGLAVTSYLALYLGLARGTLILLGPNFRARMLLGAVLVIFYLFVGAIVPLLLSYWQNSFYTVSYEPYMFSNFMWTLALLADNDVKGASSATILVLVGGVAFVLNLLFVNRDVMLIRIEAPPKVQEEEAVSIKSTELPIDPLAPES